MWGWWLHHCHSDSSSCLAIDMGQEKDKYKDTQKDKDKNPRKDKDKEYRYSARGSIIFRLRRAFFPSMFKLAFKMFFYLLHLEEIFCG